jgi:hypothetical protein
LPEPFERRPIVTAVLALAKEAAVFAFYLVLAAFATRPLVTDLRRQTLGGGNPLIDMWTIQWLARHLLSPGQLFEGNIFHPSIHAVLHSDLSMGTVVLVAPLRLFVRDPVPFYNLAVLASLAFGGWAFHLLARDLTGSRSAGLLAGVLAAFGTHQMRHVYHLNLLTTGWLALFLLGLRRLRDRPSIGSVALTGASFALCVQSSGYYGVAAAILAAIFGLAYARRMLAPPQRTAALASVLVALVLVAPYARAFMELRQSEDLHRSERHSAGEAFRPSIDLTSASYVDRFLTRSAAVRVKGKRLFPGFLALALGVVAVLRRRPHAGFLAAAAAVLVVVSLGPRVALFGRELALPYDWIFKIPPLDSMQHPYTFAAVATFLLAILAGVGWASLPLASRPVAGAAVVALAVVEVLSPPPLVQRVPTGVPPAYRLLAGVAPGPVLDLPVFDEKVLLWAARDDLTFVNGRGSFTPHGTEMLSRYVSRQWIDQTPEDVDASKPAAYLANFHARYVILPTGRRPELAGLGASFDRSRRFRKIGEAPDGDRVYEVEAGS